ncbi:Protein trichome birefringence-like 16 [Ancistrocladus abbreviatus]
MIETSRGKESSFQRTGRETTTFSSFRPLDGTISIRGTDSSNNGTLDSADLSPQLNSKCFKENQTKFSQVCEGCKWIRIVDLCAGTFTYYLSSCIQIHLCLHTEMKGGNVYYRIRGKHFPVTLVVLVITTIFLWSYEKKPLLTTILTSQDQFDLPTSDVLVVATHPKDVVKPKDPLRQENPELREETGDEPEVHSSDVAVVESAFMQPSAVEDDRNLASKKECNYAKGRWVVDNRHPLYSGFKCKQWLSEMWACRLTQRPDFSYEAYQWQPENCDMPKFEGSTFLKRMQDKTIAFVGDSLGRQQFQSLMCMVTGGEEKPEVEDVGSEYGFIIPPGGARPDGWAFRFPQTNTTILYHWSSTLCDLEPLKSTDPASNIAMHLDRPPAFLTRFLRHFDVLVLNTGHHWNRGKINANRWVMYIDGKPNQNRKLAPVGNAKNFTIYSVVRWLDSQLPFHPRLKAFFRTISPRHFFNGDWNTGGSCENTTPLAKGSKVLQDESSDPLIAGAIRGTKVRLLDITALSQLRDEGHISRYSIKASQGIQDCLHWCLPGVPDAWNEILAAQVPVCLHVLLLQFV